MDEQGTVQNDEVNQMPLENETTPTEDSNQKPLVQPPADDKMKILLLFGSVIAVIIVAWIISSMFLQSAQEAPLATPTPTTTPVEDEIDRELRDINVDSIEGEFKLIDDDLEQL